MRSTISPLMLLLVFAMPAAFAAEDIYRSTMPDGRIIYGESPFPGAKSVRKVAPPPVTTGIFVVTESEKARGTPPPQGERAPGGVSVLPADPREPTVPVGPGQLRLPASGQLPKRPY